MADRITGFDRSIFRSLVVLSKSCDEIGKWQVEFLLQLGGAQAQGFPVLKTVRITEGKNDHVPAFFRRQASNASIECGAKPLPV